MLQRRILREYMAINKDQDKQYVVSIDENELTHWTITLFGAQDTPWEGAILKLDVHFSNDYPNTSPQVQFVGAIPFHPNIYANGKICLNILNTEWSSVYGIASIMTSIQTLLVSPNPDSPANNNAAVLFTKEPREYERMVRNFVTSTWSEAPKETVSA